MTTEKALSTDEDLKIWMKAVVCLVLRKIVKIKGVTPTEKYISDIIVYSCDFFIYTYIFTWFLSLKKYCIIPKIFLNLTDCFLNPL